MSPFVLRSFVLWLLLQSEDGDAELLWNTRGVAVAIVAFVNARARTGSGYCLPILTSRPALPLARKLGMTHAAPAWRNEERKGK